MIIPFDDGVDDDHDDDDADDVDDDYEVTVEKLKGIQTGREWRRRCL